MKEICLDGKLVGKHNPIYIIAEIGGNFSDIDTGKKLIDLAIKAGADAVKIQNFKSNTITTKKAQFFLENTGNIPQHTYFSKYEISDRLITETVEYCRHKNLTVFSTPSHVSDLEILEKLNMPLYKIGSDDAVNTPFIKEIARLNKPILLSTGMCTLSEVQRSVDTILEEGNDQNVLFHCTSNYPTHVDAVNLLALQTMQSHFQFPVGYSDHTVGIDTCYAAAVLGAPILEFHFTYDKNADGPDHKLSKDFSETTELIRKVRALPQLLGDGVKRPATSEMKSRINNRKSIVLTSDVKKNEKLTLKNIALKRPGYGVPCSEFYNVLGKTASRDLQSEEALMWEDFA